MKDKISLHQLMAILWVALLAPAVELLPAATVERAGRLAWVAPLVVAPLMLLGGYYIYKVGGLQSGLEIAFGRWGSRGLLLLYIGWGGLLLALRLRLTAERLMGVGERDGALWFLLPALCLLTAWMAWGKRGAFGRTVEVFFGIIATTIIIVVGLSATEIDPLNLLPIWWTDAPDLITALPVTMGALGYGIFATAFLGETVIPRGEGRRWIWWSIGGCVVLAVIQLVILGAFGPQLTARLNSPFFALSKNIGISGVFQRVESVVAALWTLCDLAMLGLLLRSSSFLFKGLCPKWEERYIAPSVLIPAMLVAGLVIPDDFIAQNLSESWAIWGSMVMGWGIPATTIIIVAVRGRLE